MDTPQDTGCKYRIMKARMDWRQQTEQRSETRYVKIQMAGKWLEKKGFKVGQPFYIKEHPNGSLTISPVPFYQDQPIAIGTLDQLKEQFAKLNIPTTR